MFEGRGAAREGDSEPFGERKGWRLMATNLDRYEKDVERLIDTGKTLLYSMYSEYAPGLFKDSLKQLELTPAEFLEKFGRFADGYQAWYSEAKALVKQLLPDRLADFVQHYEKPRPRKVVTAESYRIEDCLLGLNVTLEEELLVGRQMAIPHFQQQIKMVQSVQVRFQSSLFDIRQLVQADLFDSELEAARELAKKGFLRAAGAVAGVVLEKHLAQVASNHSISGRKAHPSISDLNDALKGGGVYDVPEWRRIQRLGDIRNMCDHGKMREPTADEIQELIDGTDKFMRTVF